MGASQTFSNGQGRYKVVRGRQGEVTWPGTGSHPDGESVTVDFPGGKGSWANCLPTEVRRPPRRPPLPPPSRRPRRAHATLGPHTRSDRPFCRTPPPARRPDPRGKHGRHAPYRPTTPGATGREAAGVAVGGRVGAAPDGAAADLTHPLPGWWTCAGEPRSSAGEPRPAATACMEVGHRGRAAAPGIPKAMPTPTHQSPHLVTPPGTPTLTACAR